MAAHAMRRVLVELDCLRPVRVLWQQEVPHPQLVGGPEQLNDGGYDALHARARQWPDGAESIDDVNAQDGDALWVFDHAGQFDGRQPGDPVLQIVDVCASAFLQRHSAPPKNLV
jgi:hypothetical protein